MQECIEINTAVLIIEIHLIYVLTAGVLTRVKLWISYSIEPYHMKTGMDSEYQNICMLDTDDMKIKVTRYICC